MTTQSSCVHPRLMMLPVTPGHLYGIICTSCAKRLVIGCGDYIGRSGKEEFCLAVLIRDTFGEAWGQKAREQCECTACKEKRMISPIIRAFGGEYEND